MERVKGEQLRGKDKKFSFGLGPFLLTRTGN